MEKTLQTIWGRIFVSDKAFYRTILTVGVPVVLQALFTIGLNMTSTIMLGQYGEVQISASSLSNDFIMIFQILCFGTGGGAAVLTAQYWGSGDIPALKRVVTVMLWIILSFGMIFAFITAIFPSHIIALYAPNDPAIIEKGVLYLQMSAAAFPLMGLSLTLSIVLRTVRQVKVPLIASIAIFCANIIGCYIFIHGRFGLPEMQIQGAALSILICRFIECVVITGYFMGFDKKIGYRVRDLFHRISRQLVSLYIKYSVPVIVSDFLLAMGNTAIAMVMGRLGASFIAANAIIANVMRFSTVFNQGISNSSSIITGNTLGAGEKEKAYRQGITFYTLSIGLGILGAGIILLASPIMLNFFVITVETRAIERQLMFAVALMAVFQTVEGVMTKGVLRGGGDTRFLMVADVLFLWLASIPLGYVAGLVLHVPAFFIYCALRIDALIKSIWCLSRLRSRKWMRRVHD